MAVQVFKVDRKVGPSKLLIASANPTVGMPTVLAMKPPTAPPNTSVEMVCLNWGRAICTPMTANSNRPIRTPNVSVLATMRVNEPTANAGMKPTDVHFRTDRSIESRSLNATRPEKTGVISTIGTGTKSGLIRTKNGTITIPPPKPRAPAIVEPTATRTKPPINSQILTDPLCQIRKPEHTFTSGGYQAHDLCCSLSVHYMTRRGSGVRIPHVLLPLTSAFAFRRVRCSRLQGYLTANRHDRQRHN